MDDLFSAAHNGADDDGPAGTVAAPHPGAPLAVRMRPRTLDDVLGQRHLMRPGSPLRKLAEPDPDSAAGPSSVILYGPPGIGKTTLAHVIARAPGRTFTELSAITAGVKDVRQVMEQAQRERDLYGRTTVLFLDEIHRFSKAQQDALLPGVENRWVVLVAATTENPSFSVIAPLLSRSLLLTLRPLTDDDIVGLLDRAVTQERGLNGAVVLQDDARDYLVRMAGGDARRALTVLEAAAGVALDKAREAGRAGEGAVAVTDEDASMHYLARMLEAGEDPRFIARRLIISASEDVGMADPTALQTAVAAAQAVQLIGMPEGRIILAQAVTHLATAPKSNASYTAVNEAIADVRAGHTGAVPAHLRDAHYPGAAALGHGQGYVYSHDEPHAVARQQYAPDPLVGRDYYRPKPIGHEKRLTEQVAALRRIIRGD